MVVENNDNIIKYIDFLVETKAAKTTNCIFICNKKGLPLAPIFC